MIGEKGNPSSKAFSSPLPKGETFSHEGQVAKREGSGEKGAGVYRKRVFKSQRILREGSVTMERKWGQGGGSPPSKKTPCPPETGQDQAGGSLGKLRAS